MPEKKGLNEQEEQFEQVEQVETNENREPIRYFDDYAEYDLVRPVTLSDGREVETVRVRAASLEDRDRALKATKTDGRGRVDEDDVTKMLIANLCGIRKADLQKFLLCDYMALIQIHNTFTDQEELRPLLQRRMSGK